MTNVQSSGWRALRPTMPVVPQIDPADKQDLFNAARMAAEALHLPPKSRFILDQLVGCYRGELIEGRILVWPSNEFLCKRTGIAERTVRLHVALLIKEGVITPKDSANGKRFAQRSPQGQFVRAYGFDLSPLLDRLDEFKARLEAIKEADRERSLAFDELTIHRRSAQEALRTLAEVYPDLDITDLMDRALELTRVTPRRSATGSAVGARDAWQALRSEAESRYYTASAGNSCRHKDNNKYAPDQSCNNGYEDVREAKPAQVSLNVSDLARACPDAMELMGEVRSDRDFIGAVSRLRGSLGVSPSAWDEAGREIGILGASATLVYVVQMQIAPTPGSAPIKNVGGYFRVLIRLMKAGQFDLSTELLRLMRR